MNLVLTDSSKDVNTTNDSSNVNSTETTQNPIDSKYIVQHFKYYFLLVHMLLFMIRYLVHYCTLRTVNDTVSPGIMHNSGQNFVKYPYSLNIWQTLILFSVVFLAISVWFIPFFVFRFLITVTKKWKKSAVMFSQNADLIQKINKQDCSFFSFLVTFL